MEPQHFNLPPLNKQLDLRDYFDETAVGYAEAAELEFEDAQTRAFREGLFEVDEEILLQFGLDAAGLFVEVAVAIALEVQLVDGLGLQLHFQGPDVGAEAFEFAGLEEGRLFVQFFYLVHRYQLQVCSLN